MRRGRAGLSCVALSLVLAWTTALLGPSAASQGLPGRGWPITLGWHPSAWLVTALLAAAVVVGAAGLALGLSAYRHGWAPSVRGLLLGAVLAPMAFVAVPPVTSDDVYSYAAYGRMTVVGLDPYTTTPDELDDPVGRAVGQPWRHSPSVYGPLATAEQALVMRIAGTSVRTGVALLSLLSAVALAGAVLVLDRVAVDRVRAALLVGLNPLVVVPVVAGAHVDALLIVAVIGALAVVQRRPVLAGALVAAALSVKVTGALAALGLAWFLRREPRRLAAFALGLALVVPAYLMVGGTTALGQVRKASRFVSLATPWRPVTNVLDDVLGTAASRPIVTTAALLLAALLAVVLARRLPPSLGPVRPVAVVTLAWLFAAPYVLPWYDGVGWALLALLPASRLDTLLLAHTAMLSVAYLPGRNVPLPDALASAARAVRRVVAPAALTVILALAFRPRATETGPRGL